MQILIPMAGAGSRFGKAGYKMPKPLIEVAGKTLLEHSIDSFDVKGTFFFVTREFENPEWNQQIRQIIQRKRPESVQITLTHLTNGASQTCLAAANYINNDQPLVIYNCDQIFQWNPQEFLDFVAKKQPDGAVVLHNNRDPKNSFAEITDDRITKLVEKQAISNHALVGFHYWAKGEYFVNSATSLVEKFHVSGRPECYVSETYNYLLEEGKTILPYHISNNKFIPLGTPEDVNKYLGKIKEFYTAKPKTIFCDLDGTVFAHAHMISDVLTGDPTLLTGVREKFNSWDSQGHKIILVTARKESTRKFTQDALTRLGIAYDHLIMGVTSGPRVLINDKLDIDDPDRALAVNVVTDCGMDMIDWEALGL